VIVFGEENPNTDNRIGGLENYLAAINNELSDDDQTEAN